MKRNFTHLLLSVAVLFCCGVTPAAAQVPYTIGNGTTPSSSTTYPTPFGDWYEGSRQQFLFLASELTAAGMIGGNIDAIRWNVTNTNGAGIHDNYTIKIGTTTLNSLSATGWEGGLTTVYTNAAYTPVSGNNTFTFTTPFVWNGTSNIIVDVCHGGTTSWSYNASVPYTTLTFNASRSYAADGQGSLCATTNTSTSYNNQTQRPTTTFLGPAPIPCDSPLNLTVSNITYNSANVSWTPPGSVTNFEYALTTSATPPASGTLTGAASYNTGATLNNATTYYFHLRSKCSVGQPYSQWLTRSFTTLLNNGCFAPSSLTINNLHAHGVVVNWPAVAGATSYEWEIGLDPSAPTTTYFSSTGTALGRQDLQANTTYYVHVRTRCGANRVSALWATESFTTPDGPPLAVGTLNAGGLQAYPNPARESLNILTDRVPASGAQVVLKDVAGRTVATRAITARETTLSLQGIAPGMYFLHYADADGSAVLRIQKQ